MQITSFWRNAKWGGRQEALIGWKLKNKGKKSRKYLIGWHLIVNLVWGEKAQSWLGIRGWAYWMYCISGQAEHLQGQESYLSFSLLMWRLGRDGSILGLECYFDTYDILECLSAWCTLLYSVREVCIYQDCVLIWCVLSSHPPTPPPVWAVRKW